MASNKFLYFLLPVLLFISCSPGKKTTQTDNEDVIVPSSNSSDSYAVVDSPQIKFDAIQLKYAHYLNTPPQQIQNLTLYRFIDKWLATPYRWGGMNEKGIDCSAFIQRLLEEVYHVEIPRTSVQQFFDDWIDRFGSSQYLSEGDLVFFRTMDDKLISHVGLYLKNRMFVNSSSSKGVSIANLDDAYWRKRFVAAGRIKISMLNAKK